ncbi:MAG: hypothetical protein U0V74_16630 [Chitinophagales bacterium]
MKDFEKIVLIMICALASCNTNNRHDVSQVNSTTHYYDNGVVKDSVVQLEKSIYKKYLYDSTGVLLESGFFRDGKRIGPWLKYLPNGGLKPTYFFDGVAQEKIFLDSADYFFKTHRPDGHLAFTSPANWLSEKINTTGNIYFIQKDKSSEAFLPNILVYKGSLNEFPKLHKDSIALYYYSILNYQHPGMELQNIEWHNDAILTLYYLYNQQGYDLIEYDILVFSHKEFYAICCTVLNDKHSGFLKYSFFNTELLYSITYDGERLFKYPS